MKRFTLSLLVLALLTSLSFAQGTGQNQNMMQHGHMRSSMQGMGGHGMGGSMIYTMMVHNVIMNAGEMDLTETQKKEMAELNDKYMNPMTQKESDLRAAHKQMIMTMQDPNFDPKTLKSEIKSSNDINLELADMMVDAMASARKTLGPEKFKQCMSMKTGMNRPMQKGQMMKNNQSQ